MIYIYIYIYIYMYVCMFISSFSILNHHLNYISDIKYVTTKMCEKYITENRDEERNHYEHAEVKIKKNIAKIL